MAWADEYNTYQGNEVRILNAKRTKTQREQMELDELIERELEAFPEKEIMR